MMDGACGKIRRAVVYLMLLVIGGATSLKNLKITAPQRVRVGDSALLTCSYDLEDTTLYSIKWYLDDQEFYRYRPGVNPPHNTFKERNIEINVPKSNDQELTLDNVQKNHTGKYKCEVTEEAPYYETKVEVADILVVDVPESEPKITVDRLRLPAGETLRASCTSGAASIAPNITWTLNGEPLKNKTMSFRVTSTVHKYNDLTPYKLNSELRKSNDKKYDKNFSQSMLSLNTSGLFQDGRIRLRCFAEITPIYKVAASVEIIEDEPYLASITGDASPHSRQSNGCGHLIPSPMQTLGLAMLSLRFVLGLLQGALSTR